MVGSWMEQFPKQKNRVWIEWVVVQIMVGNHQFQLYLGHFQADTLRNSDVVITSNDVILT